MGGRGSSSKAQSAPLTREQAAGQRMVEARKEEAAQRRRDRRERNRRARSEQLSATLSGYVRTYLDESSPGTLVQGRALAATNNAEDMLRTLPAGTTITVDSNYREISGGSYPNWEYQYSGGTYRATGRGQWVHYGPNNSVPEKPVVSEFKLSDEQIAELDLRFEAMKPYLKEGSWKQPE